MSCLIVGHIWQEEEVAIAMAKFELGSYDVVAAQTEVCHEEALDVALALNGVAH